MDKKLHARLIKVSGEISKKLSGEIRGLGPIEFPGRKHKNLSNFLIRAVVGQQLSTKAAQTIRERIENARQETGERSPEFFREENAALIRSCGLSAGKTKALGHIREAHLAGRLSGAKLGAMNHKERTAHLSSIWGIGPWTCDMAAIFFFRDEDIWPEGDVSVQNTFRRYIGRRKPSLAAARFAPHRSYLALYMWRILDGGG